MSTWNFRIGTKLYRYKNMKVDPERLFSVIEVYYDDDNNPVSYGGKNLLKDIESIKGIKWAIKHIPEAFEKPIIDMDNFPKEWKDE